MLDPSGKIGRSRRGVGAQLQDECPLDGEGGGWSRFRFPLALRLCYDSVA